MVGVTFIVSWNNMELLPFRVDCFTIRAMGIRNETASGLSLEEAALQLAQILEEPVDAVLKHLPTTWFYCFDRVDPIVCANLSDMHWLSSSFTYAKTLECAKLVGIFHGYTTLEDL